jgi:phosphoserine phosphatase
MKHFLTPLTILLLLANVPAQANPFRRVRARFSKLRLFHQKPMTPVENLEPAHKIPSPFRQALSLAAKKPKTPLVRKLGTPLRDLHRWFQLIRLPPKMRAIVKQLLKNHPNGGIAAFDADGTLWDEDVGIATQPGQRPDPKKVGFFEFLMEKKAYPKERMPMLERRWKQYLAGKFSSEDMYNLMVTAAEGMPEKRMEALADEFVRKHDLGIYEPMAKLVRTLDKVGITPYVVSGSPRWVVAAGAKLLGIPKTRVIGLSAVVKDGKLTGTLETPIPWEKGKAQRILDIGRPLLVAGNSYGDLQMLNIANEVRLVVNPGKDIIDKAKKRNWGILKYNPTDVISEEELTKLRAQKFDRDRLVLP